MADTKSIERKLITRRGFKMRKKVFVLVTLLVVSMMLAGCANPIDKIKDKISGAASDSGFEVSWGEGDDDGFSMDVDFSWGEPTEDEFVEDGEDEAVPVEEPKKEEKREKTFAEKHPYLFAFRFDGENAYIDNSSWQQPDTNVGKPATDVIDLYTDITFDGMPAPLHVSGTVMGYTLTSQPDDSKAVFQYTNDSSASIVVSYVASDNYEKEKETVYSASGYRSYDFTSQKLSTTFKNADSAEYITMDYTLTDGTKGSVAYALIIKLSDDKGYIFVRNNRQSKQVSETSLKSVLSNNLSWSE